MGGRLARSRRRERDGRKTGEKQEEGEMGTRKRGLVKTKVD